MAYTGSPVNDTYSSHQLAAIYPINLRPGQASFTKDSGMVNILPYKEVSEDGNVQLIGEARDGVSAVQIGSETGLLRGFYVWQKSLTGNPYYFAIVGTKILSSTDGSTWNLQGNLTFNFVSPVRFCEFINDSNQKKLVIVDGYDGWVFSNVNTGAKITDVDFPSPHIPFPVFMDGYLFLAKTDTGDIYNSDLNDPTSWTAGSFISSEVYPDDIQALVKINNYIMCLGIHGCEFFYDAANATAPPLARYEGALMPFGSSFPNSIASTDDTAILIANNNDGEIIIKMVQGTNHKDIQCRFLANIIDSGGNWDTTTFRGFLFRQQGKLFYGLSFNGTTSRTGTEPTIAYSFEEDMWVELRYNTTYGLPVFFTTPSTTTESSTYVAGWFNNIPFWGSFAPNVGDKLQTGTTIGIYQELRTPNLNFNTLNRKFMYRFGVEYRGGTGSEVLNVAWSDDDYNTWSSGVNLAGTNQTGDGGWPMITQLGSFRQRAFKVSYTSGTTSTWMRWKALHVDINKAQQ